MAEYIEKQAAIDALGEEPEIWCETDEETAIRSQWETDKAAIESVPPADVQPVVRCKNCRYSRVPDRHNLAENAVCEGVLICFVGYDHVYPSISNDVFVFGEHFCGYGEVRDG